jgi:hypothetical protein
VQVDGSAHELTALTVRVNQPLQPVFVRTTVGIGKHQNLASRPPGGAIPRRVGQQAAGRLVEHHLGEPGLDQSARAIVR